MKKFFRDTVCPILDGMASALTLFPRPEPPKIMDSRRRIKAIKLPPRKEKKKRSD